MPNGEEATVKAEAEATTAIKSEIDNNNNKIYNAGTGKNVGLRILIKRNVNLIMSAHRNTIVVTKNAI